MPNNDKPTYKKVRKEGSSTVLTMGKLIPEGWEIVKMTPLARDESSVTIKIERQA